LFGYEKGAFTGALRRHSGRMEQAHGGTLFLDEIGDLSPLNQARILRAIENGTFHRLGAEKETSVDVRVVSATNRNIADSVKSGEFRKDLYHRLNGFEIHMPPLRMRVSDIPILAEYFFEEAKERAKRPLRAISPEAIDYLKGLPWPGNVRELRSAIERAVHTAASDTIQVNDLEENVSETFAVPLDLTTLQEVERRQIALTLDKCHGNISAAARILGISRNTLYSKINEYGLSQVG